MILYREKVGKKVQQPFQKLDPIRRILTFSKGPEIHANLFLGVVKLFKYGKRFRFAPSFNNFFMAENNQFYIIVTKMEQIIKIISVFEWLFCLKSLTFSWDSRLLTKVALVKALKINLLYPKKSIRFCLSNQDSMIWKMTGFDAAYIFQQKKQETGKNKDPCLPLYSVDISHGLGFSWIEINRSYLTGLISDFLPCGKLVIFVTEFVIFLKSSK